MRRLLDQIVECKSQCRSVKDVKLLNVPVMVVGNKCDLEKDRVIHQYDVNGLLEGRVNTSSIECSAKKNVNIEDVFVRLFHTAKLPSEMSPSLHRKVHPQYVGKGSSPASGRVMSIRRKTSDACGAVAPNARRPSIRTDLLVAQSRTTSGTSPDDDPRDVKCVIQ